MQNRPVMEFGRDKLLEELVAFANADGGVLILGMIEGGSKPTTAEGLDPLPEIGDPLSRALTGPHLCLDIPDWSRSRRLRFPLLCLRSRQLF